MSEEKEVKGTEEVKEETMQAEAKLATLEDLKKLKDKRIEKAQDFVIPGTDLKVKIAPVSQVERYKMLIKSLDAFKELSGETTEAEKKVKAIEAIANSLIMACVIEPKMNEEAIKALNEYSAEAVDALLAKCKEVSGLKDDMNTDLLETFLWGGRFGGS